MKVENFKDYAKNAITESIKVMSSVKDVIEFYGDGKKCTIHTYFAAQIKDGVIFDSTDEMSDETEIGNIDDSDLDIEFEDARSGAFGEWFSSLCDDADSDKLIDLGDDEVFNSAIVDVDEDGLDVVIGINVSI